MPQEQSETLDPASGDPLQRNPPMSAEFLKEPAPSGQSSALISFSLALSRLAQSPMVHDQGRRNEVNPYDPQSLHTIRVTNPSNTPFSGTEGSAASSRWVETQQVRPEEIGADHRHANAQVVNIERAGNVLMGPNYGYAINIEEFNVLRNLPLHPDISGHLSDYFPDSRTDDEARILQWVDSNQPPELVLCVLGRVGVGKSTMAKHLAARLRQDRRLAAEVFLGFALPDWTPESVIRMASGQLCGTYPVLKRAIAEALDLDVGPSVSLETRIRRLILEPIRSLGLPHSLVVVLDALDQWAPHAIFIKALTDLTTESHLIRFIGFGRPGLEDHFENVCFRIYNLPNVAKSILNNYFSERFTQVLWEYGRKPSSHVIEQLVDKADGLFIWGSTLCSMLEDRHSCPNPHDTLTAILQSQQSIGDNDILAKLYHGAINMRFPKPDHKAKLAVFLGAVMVLQEPLPISVFAPMVSMGVRAVQNILADLGALQAGKQESNQDLVLPAGSMFHLSFLEYLQSLETPAHLAFPIDAFTSHSELGKACLQEMRHVVQSPQSTFISPLQKYAMRYWPVHTAHGTPTVSPTSDVEWKSTPHFAILDSLSVPEWHHWATLYIRLFHPDAAQLEDLRSVEPTQPQQYPKGAKHLSPRRVVQALWRKISHQPAQRALGTSTDGTRQHSISRVNQLLLKGPGTEGTPDTIAVAEVAVRLQHQSLYAWLELATVYYRHAAQTSASHSLIDNATRACRCAAEVGGYEMHQVRWMLALCLMERFGCIGLKEDLEEAISLQKALVLLTPPGHPDRPASFNNLAMSLWSEFRVTGSIASLEESIVLNREVLSLWTPGHPDRPSSLNNLANSLRSQFEVTGCIASLEESIVHDREALSLLPPGHPDRPSSLNNLAYSLRSQFEATGCIASLEESIVLNREALSLLPPGHPDRPSSLSNLANSLQSQFEATGCIASLEESIVLNREALSLLPPGHPDHPSSLSNLANSLQSQFEATGCIASLEESIVLNREALSLLPPGHPNRPFPLTNLAESLQSQFEVTGCTASLDTAIALKRDALLLWMPGHPNRPWALDGLAKSLHSRHNVAASSGGLNEAIALSREALSIWLQGCPYRVKALSTLASSLDSHFELTGIRKSLDEAISLHHEAVSILPTNHPKHALSLSSLASSLQKSYKLTGNIEHLNEAISLVPATHGV